MDEDEIANALFGPPAKNDPVADALFGPSQHPGMVEARKRYQPDLKKQDELMDAPVVGPAVKRAFATDPALSTASMVLGGGAEALGIPVPAVVSPSAQVDFLAGQAPSDPGAQAELDARALMAKGGIPGATMAGARGLAGGAEAVFSLVPGAQGIGQLGKGAAAALPPMLLPAAAGALAPAVPGMDALAELPAAGGRAIARAVGAEEGGTGEALGGTLGAIAPAFAPLALAKGAGKAMGAGTVEPAFRVGQTPISRLGPAVAREGGLASILKRSPTVGYQAANIGAMLPQAHIAPEASRLASGLGASPEGAELIGQMTGIAGTLPVAAMEGRLAKVGAQQGMAEQAAKAKAADAAKAKAAEDAQIAALKSHEAPMEPTADQRDTAYLQEMMAKDAERKRALAGVAGAVEGARGVEQAKVEEAFPPVPLQPKVVPPKVSVPKVTEGPGMDPVAYEEALEQAAPIPGTDALAAEMRKPVDALRAEREAAAAKAMAEKDRAASEKWNREATYDEAAMKWDAMDVAERQAVAERLPPGILRTPEVGRSFDKFRVDQQEHLAEAMKDPAAFAEVMPDIKETGGPDKAPAIGAVPTVPAAGEAPAKPSSQPPSADTPLNPDAPPPPKAESPPPPKPSKVEKLAQSRLRTHGEATVNGTNIRLDTSSQPYRVIVDQKEVFSGSPEEAFAAADREISKAAKGHTLGVGLGAIDLDDPATRRAIRGTLGGATGYIVGIANDEPDDTPEGRAARRALWTAAGVASATGIPKWKSLSGATSRLAKKARPAWFREYFGNPNERISETVAAIERGNLDKVELGKTEAHIEALRAPDLKGSQARIYQDYLRGDPKAKEVFPKLVAHIRQTNPELADAMEQGADFYKPRSVERTKKEVDAGVRTPEAQEEYAEGHAQRVYQKDSEKPARPHGVNRNKVRMGEQAKDAPYWKGRLDPVTVELLMDEYGLPKPTGQNTYFRGTEEGGTLVKWFPDAEGEKARQDFLVALSLYAKENAVKPISAGRIVGGGDDRMVVQVGSGSRADIGHLVSKVSGEPNELLSRVPRRIADEVVKTLGIEAPTVTRAGPRLRYAFKDPGDVARFEDAVRELAVEGSTFNVTPAAKAYFRNRLKGAKVKMGPGQSGGTGHLTEETGPAMNYRERRESGEVYNPKAVTYKSSYEQAKRIANAEMWQEYATKSDEHGPFAAEIPVDEDGKRVGVDKDGNFTVNGIEYRAIPADKTGKENFGALAGKGLRKDVFDFKTEQREIEQQASGFVHGMLSKWKSLKTGTPVWAALNIPSDLAFAYGADTSPVGGPSNWKSYWSVGKDFLRYIRSGDPTHVKRHVEGPGIRFHEKMTTGDADADAALESIMFGAKESAAKKWEKRGETAMDIASLGTLAGKNAATGAAIGAAGGAAAGAAMGIADDDSWDEILKRAGKGAAIGAGANLTARSIRKTGPLIDAYFKAVAYDIMTKRQGYSHAEAKARVRKFFQNYEEPSKALRIATGKTGNPLAFATANPFMSFYSELLRIGGNMVAENPVRAAAVLGAIPVAASVYNHFAGTFKNPEEARAAGEVAPTGIVGRNKEGGLTSVELGRVNPGADFLADIIAVTKSPNKDTARRIFTTFGGSTPILNIYDAGKTYFVPDTRDLRTGMEIRRPGESPARAATRHAMATATSPLAPEFGTTEQFVEKSLTEPFQRGSRPDEARPDRAIIQSLTGVRLKDIDFGKEARSLRGKRGAMLRDADEALAKAKREKNIWSDPERREKAKAEWRRARKEAIDLYRTDRARKTPQPVGEGR